MRLFKQNNNENDNNIVEALQDIASAVNNNDDYRELESKINDVEYRLIEEIGVLNSYNTNLEKTVEKQNNLILQLNNDLNDVKKQIKGFNEELKSMEKEGVEHRTTPLRIIYAEKLREAYQNQAVMEIYTGNQIMFDGFNFIRAGGRGVGEILYNILDIQNIDDHLEKICKNILLNGNPSYYASKYNIKNFKMFLRILYNLCIGGFYDKYLELLQEQHTYQFKQDTLYIDDENTGLKKDDVQYIKTCIINTENKNRTIKNFMQHFNKIDNNYIRIISLNIDKIPLEMLTSNCVIENNPEKRKEKGMI
ncbi:hypothetical protein [Methanobrevibacter sp.]